MDISIIIPTKNRQEVLKQTLEFVVSAIDGKDIEIIVVNDGDEITNKIEYNKLQYLKNTNNGVTFARNLGARMAKGNIFFFLDDDMWISTKTINVLEKIKNDAYFDSNVLCLNWKYPEALIHKIKSEKLGRYFLQNGYHTMEGRNHTQFDHTKEIIEANGLGSASLVISKNNFQKIGGYNEKISFQGEDVDLYAKLKQHNIQTNTYVPILCLHNDSISTNIHNFNNRQLNGYLSQAKAEKDKLIISLYPDRNSFKNRIYSKLLKFENILTLLFLFIPNYKIFDFFSFKLIGLLSSMQRIKAYKKIFS